MTEQRGLRQANRVRNLSGRQPVWPNLVGKPQGRLNDFGLPLLGWLSDAHRSQPIPLMKVTTY